MQLPSGRWRVQLRRKGYPPFDKVFRSEREARAQEKAVRQEQAAVLVPQQLTVAEVWARYAQSYEYQGKAQHTQKTEASRIKPVLDALGAYALPVLEQAPHLVYDYIDRRTQHVSPRTKRKLSPSSVRLEVAALSSLVAWAKRRKLVAANFLRHIDRPGQAKRKRRVAPIEQAALTNAMLDREQPKLAEAARFALLLRALGCRPGELAAALRADVEQRKGELLFRDTKFRKELRRVPLHREALGLIDAQLRYAAEAAEGSPYIFTTKGRARDADDDRWRPYGYSCAIKRLREAGVVPDDFHAHAMRREFISRAIEAGLQYATIRKVTGHHSTQAIEIYDEGLSTAPEVRAALEQHHKTVQNERLLAQLENMGATPEMLEAFAAQMRGEKPKPYRRVMLGGK
ncbi:MAG: tyrosine-type recombinase/integrase [Pseudomonadota bacterium]|jgi:site-specific recombinase XerD|nr:site-specific integrase [Rubrivivax sp.]